MSGNITKIQGNDETCVVWTIDNFLNIQKVEITSDKFSHGYHVFQLRIYPRDTIWFETLTPPVLSMKLIGRGSCSYANDAKCKNIEYIMGIIKADKSEFRNENSISVTNASDESTPVHELISRYDLELHKNDMVPEGTLTVFCNIRHVKKKPAVKVISSTPLKYDGVSTLSKNLKDVYLSQRYTDVKIRVKNKEFPAHKLILCSRCEVFAAMFEHDSAEERSGIVTVTDCDPESFEYFLLYLYTGKLDMDTVSSDKAVSLYQTADKYGLKELKQDCIGYMIKGMTVDSFCDILHLALMHNESGLLDNLTNFFSSNGKSILTTEKWLLLLEEHSLQCKKLLMKLSFRATQPYDDATSRISYMN